MQVKVFADMQFYFLFEDINDVLNVINIVFSDIGN